MSKRESRKEQRREELLSLARGIDLLKRVLEGDKEIEEALVRTKGSAANYAEELTVWTALLAKEDP